jgi:hypothetical protein
MTASERLLLDANQLLEWFPGEATLVTRLLVESDAFRNLCEDLVLARDTLMRLESFQGQQEPLRIAEYRQVIAELESEVAEALQHAKQSKQP